MTALWYLLTALALLLIIRTKAHRLFLVPWLWIPRDEFAPTFELDANFMLRSPPWVRTLYQRNLIWRRNVAHRRDMCRSA